LIIFNKPFDSGDLMRVQGELFEKSIISEIPDANVFETTSNKTITFKNNYACDITAATV
jgi:hypothetical protein